MVETKQASGLSVTWGMEHRDGEGNLIVRQASITPPRLDCIKLGCIFKFLAQSITYSLVMLYHQRRIGYAEAHRRDKILERYRTGDPSPSTFFKAILAHIKLSCPICRRVEIGYPK